MIDYQKLYREYLNFSRNNFFRNYLLWFGSKKIPKQRVLDIFNSYYKPSFFSFLNDIRFILYLKNPFNFVLKEADDRWAFFEILDFLVKKGMIRTKNNRIIILNKNFLKDLPPVLSEREIKKRLEKKLGRELEEKEPVNRLFRTKVKKSYDQLPISVSSAIFLTRKILERLPFNQTFLFLGDDDFVSLFLTLSCPQLEVLVIDIDRDLLAKIRELRGKFKLKIGLRRIDLTNPVKLGEFTGFLTNPPQNYFGIKKFVSFGLKNLGKNGGSVLVEITDENIGNRYLLLQKFFNSKNLIIEEVITEKLYYPYFSLHQEDEFIDGQLKRYFSEKFIKNQVKEGIDLWVMEYYPWKIKEPQKGKLFEYL